MKKICFVNPHYYKYTVGGAEVQMYLMARELVKLGWIVFYANEDIDEPEEHEGIQLVPLKKNCNYIEFKKVLEKIDADLYYERGRKKHTYYMGRYASEAQKVFIFASSMEIDCNLFKNTFRDTNSFKSLLKIIKNFHRNLAIDLLSAKAMKEADCVLSQTEGQKMLLKKKLNIKSTIFPNIHEVPNTIKKKEPPVVLWLASLKSLKHPEIFIEAVEALQHLNCYFILAGRMVDHRYEDLIRKAEDRYNNFQYLSEVSFERSNQLIAEASIFVSTSPKEGFPNTFIQSWLRETPTLSLRFDPDNIISNNKIGCVSSDIANLVENIEYLIKSPMIRQEMGVKARVYATERHGIDDNIRKFEGILKNLIN